jgi:glutamate racemase
MKHPSGSIGIFDSGLGGLTILKALKEALPEEDFIYFGDTANVPYGGKTPEEICRIALNGALFLKKHYIKLLIIACHTACAFSLDEMRRKLDIPVVGVIEKSLEALIETTLTNHIGIIATKATTSSKTYSRALAFLKPSVSVTTVACPLFVPMIEEGLDHHPIMEVISEHYFSSFENKNIDTLLLACTHYPLLMPLLQKKVPKGIKLLDPAPFCASSTKSFLERLNLINASNREGSITVFVSRDPPQFQKLAKRFFGTPLSPVLLRKETS